jgi:hypothetical protein
VAVGYYFLYCVDASMKFVYDILLRSRLFAYGVLAGGQGAWLTRERNDLI